MRSPFIVRCYAKQQEGQWVALCIDLDLAAQGETLESVREKLSEQVASYLEEAISIDRAHAVTLLTRKAPFRYRAEYQWLRALHGVMRRVPAFRALVVSMQGWRKNAAFDEVVPDVRLHAA